MAYLNKFDNQEALNNYIASQEYSEPFVGYTVDPYELVEYNITNVMQIYTATADLKVPVQRTYPNKNFQTFPIYNNEYLSIFTVSELGDVCVVPVTIEQGTYYQIVPYDDSTNQITNPESMNIELRAGAIIFRHLRSATQPDDYYKRDDGFNPDFKHKVNEIHNNKT